MNSVSLIGVSGTKDLLMKKIHRLQSWSTASLKFGGTGGGRKTGRKTVNNIIGNNNKRIFSPENPRPPKLVDGIFEVWWHLRKFPWVKKVVRTLSGFMLTFLVLQNKHNFA